MALLAKTAEPHPKLAGTIYTAAEAIEAAGGQALPIVGDVRDEESVVGAVAQTVEKFGGIDIVVNNASAIDLSDPESLAMKKYDLMQDINARGSFLLSRHLRAAPAQGSRPARADVEPAAPRWTRSGSAGTSPTRCRSSG